MGFKKKKTAAPPKEPTYPSSVLMYGNQTVGKNYRDANGNIVSQYLPSPEEQARQKMTQSKINLLLQGLGQTAPEQEQDFNNQRDAYVGQQTDLFNQQYDKSLRSLREDIGSRFGTLQATPYFDQLGDMERNIRMPAYLDIARQGTLMKNSLYDQDQSRKLQELQALGYNLSADQQTFLNSLKGPTQASQSQAGLDSNKYLAQLQQQENEANRQTTAQNGFMNFLGSIGSAFLKS